jgi:hypothetical protein
MRKMVWILLSVALMFGIQTGAQAAGSNDVGASVVAVQNAEVPAVQTQGNLTDETIYYEDFESGMGDWTSYDAGDIGDMWHIDTFNAYAGNSWWMGMPALGGYDNHWLQYLMTPSLDFTGALGPVLTYKMFYAVEDPGGEPPPYDGWDGCNVWASIDGGSNWTVINPDFPAYNCANLYSFGEEWGMGPGIAGWGGSSGGWVDAQFDLTALVGQADVMIRFAFASDPAYCTIDNPLLLGYFVDNVSIDDGATQMLYNDADTTPYPAEFATTNGSATGDYWVLTTSSSAPPSPVTSARCNTYLHYGLSDALVSPWIDIPAEPGVNTFLSFWLWCNMMDFTGGGGTSLEDYYHVEISTDEVIWNELFYDYGDNTRPGGHLVGWQQYLEGMQYNGTLTLSPIYAGETVKLRWRVITDWNDDGGVTPLDGLYIDAVEVYTVSGLNHDVGADRMHVPMPTSMYFADIGCSVELHNYGLSDESSVPAFYRVNYSPIPLIPWAVIPAGGMELKAWDWVPPGVGSYFMDSYTMLATDEDMSNDTSKAGLVDVTPANVLEFGYDARQYSYEPSIYFFNFETGEGQMIRYTPADDGVTENLNAVSHQGLWRDPGTIRVHVYDEGTTTTPGAELAVWDETISVLYPAWNSIDLSGIPELQGFNHEFWVFFELLNDLGEPHIYGHDYTVFGENHMFADFGGGMGQSDYDFYGRVVCEPAGGGNPDVTIAVTNIGATSFVQSQGGLLEWNIAAQNNETTTQISDIWCMLRLPNGSYYGPVMGPVLDYPIPGGWSGNRDRDLNIPPGAAPVGTYQLVGYIGEYDTNPWSEDEFNFEVTAGDGIGHPVTNPWFGSGGGEDFLDLLPQAGAEVLPGDYSMTQNYPNPFNPTTMISFALPQDAKVLLSVYDVSGRQVATLVDGYRGAGVHDVTFDASNLASGIYLYRLQAGDFNATGKMVLMK